MKRLAVAGRGLSAGSAPAAPCSFRSASARASGSPDRRAPLASAMYSREREIPSCTQEEGLELVLHGREATDQCSNGTSGWRPVSWRERDAARATTRAAVSTARSTAA